MQTAHSITLCVCGTVSDPLCGGSFKQAGLVTHTVSVSYVEIAEVFVVVQRIANNKLIRDFKSSVCGQRGSN